MRDNGLILLLLGAGTVLVGASYYASVKQISNEKITIVEPVTTFADTPTPMDIPLKPLETTGAPPQGQEFKNDKFKHGYIVAGAGGVSAVGIAGTSYVLYRYVKSKTNPFRGVHNDHLYDYNPITGY